VQQEQASLAKLTKNEQKAYRALWSEIENLPAKASGIARP
jgi:hypothetical protein